MAFETKVLLLIFADILQTSDSLEEAHIRLAKIANAGGVIIEEYVAKETMP